MNVNKIQFKWFLVAIVLATLMVTSITHAAITKAQPNKKPAVVLFVESEDLAGLKQAFVDVNLHLKKEGRSPDQEIKIILHGSGVRFFKKSGLDPELEYMLKWFQDEGIQVGVCEGCLEEHSVDKDALFSGLQVWQVTTRKTPVSKSPVFN